MSWGISEKASDKEKLKAKMADYLHGLNSCCKIDYGTYTEEFDFTMKLLDEMYELGKQKKLRIKYKINILGLITVATLIGIIIVCLSTGILPV